MTDQQTAAASEGREIPATEDGVVIRPALEVLSRLNEGRLMDQLSVELNAVIAAVQHTRKKGSLTLKLDIDPEKKIHNGVYVTASIDGNEPKPPPPASLFFADDDGNLHTRDPSQIDAFETGPRTV